jgi:four helix bundle protein
VLNRSPQALEDRLIDFGAAICDMLRRAPKDLVGEHLAKQLIRSCTSPAANYAEARSAESRRDFAHKMQICLKELRETAVWLRFADRLCRAVNTSHLTEECNQLISIFVSSIKTAKARSAPQRG